MKPGTRRRDVAELLRLLGYEEVDRSAFVHRGTETESIDAVSATIKRTNPIQVETRTSPYRSKLDADTQNTTIRLLRKFFGGHFVSDRGRNRYLPDDGPMRAGAEMGCFKAWWHVHNNLTRASVCLMQWSRVPEPSPRLNFIFPTFDWQIVSANLLLPLLVAVIEEYFKSTFRALLQVSATKVAVLGNVRLSNDDMAAVLERATSLEDTVCRRMSFQNLESITRAFGAVCKGLDILAPLKAPDPGRKERLITTLERILRDRHRLIHQNSIEPSYDFLSIEGDIESVGVALARIYESIAKRHGWHMDSLVRISSEFRDAQSPIETGRGECVGGQGL